MFPALYQPVRSPFVKARGSNYQERNEQSTVRYQKCWDVV